MNENNTVKQLFTDGLFLEIEKGYHFLQEKRLFRVELKTWPALEIPQLKEGLDKRIDYMQARQGELVQIVTEMLLPISVRSAILDFVKENKDLDTKKLHGLLNHENRVLDHAFWYAFRELEKNGEIVSFKQGRGKARIWRVKQ